VVVRNYMMFFSLLIPRVLFFSAESRVAKDSSTALLDILDQMSVDIRIQSNG